MAKTHLVLAITGSAAGLFLAMSSLTSCGAQGEAPLHDEGPLGEAQQPTHAAHVTNGSAGITAADAISILCDAPGNCASVWNGTHSRYEVASWWASNPLSAAAGNYWGRTVAANPIYTSTGTVVCDSTHCTGSSSSADLSSYDSESASGSCSNTISDSIARQTLAIAQMYSNPAEGIMLNVGGPHMSYTTAAGDHHYSFAWNSATHTTMGDIQLYDDTWGGWVTGQAWDIALRVGPSGGAGSGSCSGSGTAPTFYGCVSGEVINKIAWVLDEPYSGTYYYIPGKFGWPEVEAYMSCRMCSDYASEPTLCPPVDWTNGGCHLCILGDYLAPTYPSDCYPDTIANVPYQIECASSCYDGVDATYTDMEVFDSVDSTGNDLLDSVNTVCMCETCDYWYWTCDQYDTCDSSTFPRPSQCPLLSIGGGCVCDAACQSGACSGSTYKCCQTTSNSCSTASDCCSGVCTSNACQCLGTGATCEGNAACCSGNCTTGGTCH